MKPGGIAQREDLVQSFYMSDKQLALETINDLPDEVTMSEISDKIEFLAAIQKGLDQVERGETVPHAEVKRQLAQWLSP